MVYCVVPIALVLVTVFTSLYCFLSRRNKDHQRIAPRRTGAMFAPVAPTGKKDYQPITRQTPQSSLLSNGNTASNGSKTSSGYTPYAPNAWNPNTTHSSSLHSFQHHPTQLPNPQQQPISPSPSSFYNYSGLQSMVSQPTYWHPPAPSVATETSFDQYSAIMGNSSTGDFAMNRLPPVPPMPPQQSQSQFAFRNV